MNSITKIKPVGKVKREENWLRVNWSVEEAVKAKPKVEEVKGEIEGEVVVDVDGEIRRMDFDGQWLEVEKEVMVLTREDFEEEEEEDIDFTANWMEAADSMRLTEDETDRLRELAWEWDRWEVEGEEYAEYFPRKYWSWMCYPTEEGMAIKKIYERVERPNPEL